MFGSAPQVTYYIGELIFEGNPPVLKQINHSEARVLPDGANWEYQYQIKDIWNNVRVTFTTKSDIESPTATMEGANVSSEAGKFLYYEEAVKVNTTLFDHTNAGGTYYSTRLNGSANERTGLAKSICKLPKNSTV